MSSRPTAVPTAGAAPIRRWLGILLAILILGILGLFAGETSLPVYWRLGRHRRALQQEVDRLREQQAALEQDLQRLDSDPDLLERIAREKYHLRRPDEQVLEILEKPARSGVTMEKEAGGERTPPP